ncbi:hypothetical protein O53_1899 [Microcystis aeruginosa TAIHU98]|uniref:Uncharacterized protein n=2 Tax=Microcystis aeruginosa TaxID=1126 RepID=L7EEH9_MICAE|nr:hypothetical protein BH695_1188 [Microcystis aeruginosa PCC 7806SL]ELP57286.1 hypothetical protein O53_1899 [Microcystis aeruginosa TAIHU98]ODV36725.1 hypothetical protein BFG60_3788 [Microcystis aeruginosa NIES-98]
MLCYYLRLSDRAILSLFPHEKIAANPIGGECRFIVGGMSSF